MYTDFGDIFDQALAVALQTDGKIIAAGLAAISNGNRAVAGLCALLMRPCSLIRSQSY
jgi:hypothetical protein